MNSSRLIGRTGRRLGVRLDRRLLKRENEAEKERRLLKLTSVVGKRQRQLQELMAGWTDDLDEDLSILQSRQERDHDALLERIEQVTKLALQNEERITRASYVLGRILPYVSEVSLSCALVQKLCEPSVDASVLRAKQAE